MLRSAFVQVLSKTRGASAAEVLGGPHAGAYRHPLSACMEKPTTNVLDPEVVCDPVLVGDEAHQALRAVKCPSTRHLHANSYL